MKIIKNEIIKTIINSEDCSKLKLDEKFKYKNELYISKLDKYNSCDMCCFNPECTKVRRSLFSCVKFSNIDNTSRYYIKIK